MAGRTRLRKGEVAEALRQAANLKTRAAEILGVDRKTLYTYLQKHPDLEAIGDEIQETMLDVAESKMYTMINGGDKTMIIFYLKTKGRQRGYVERREIEGEITTKFDKPPVFQLMPVERTEEDIEAADVPPDAAPPADE